MPPMGVGGIGSDPAYKEITKLEIEVELQRKAAVERTVLAGSGPWITYGGSSVKRLRRVADFAVFKRNQWRITNKVRQLAAKVIRHRFHIDCSIIGSYRVGPAGASKFYRGATHRNDLAKR